MIIHHIDVVLGDFVTISDEDKSIALYYLSVTDYELGIKNRDR